MSSLRGIWGSPGDDPAVRGGDGDDKLVVLRNGDGRDEEHRGRVLVVAGRDREPYSLRLPVAQTEERRLVNDVESFDLANLILTLGELEEVVALSDRRVDEGVRTISLRRRRERASTRSWRRPRARPGAPLGCDE